MSNITTHRWPKLPYMLLMSTWLLLATRLSLTSSPLELGLFAMGAVAFGWMFWARPAELFCVDRPVPFGQLSGREKAAVIFPVLYLVIGLAALSIQAWASALVAMGLVVGWSAWILRADRREELDALPAQ